MANMPVTMSFSSAGKWVLLVSHKPIACKFCLKLICWLYDRTVFVTSCRNIHWYLCPHAMAPNLHCIFNQNICFLSLYQSCCHLCFIFIKCFQLYTNLENNLSFQLIKVISIIKNKYTFNYSESDIMLLCPVELCTSYHKKPWFVFLRQHFFETSRVCYMFQTHHFLYKQWGVFRSKFCPCNFGCWKLTSELWRWSQSDVTIWCHTQQSTFTAAAE